MRQSRAPRFLPQTCSVFRTSFPVPNSPALNTLLDAVTSSKCTWQRRVMKAFSAGFSRARVRTCPTAQVHGPSDSFQVIGINAVTSAAKMIKVKTLGNLTLVMDIEGSVRESRPVLPLAQDAVSVGVEPARPEPASTWGLGVHVEPSVHACIIGEVM